MIVKKLALCCLELVYVFFFKLGWSFLIRDRAVLPPVTSKTGMDLSFSQSKWTQLKWRHHINASIELAKLMQALAGKHTASTPHRVRSLLRRTVSNDEAASYPFVGGGC